MVSWKDGATSEDSPLSYEREPYIPHTIVDLEWCGVVAGGRLCNHIAPMEKAVVFEGANTGHRFYGCAKEEGYNCGLIEWVDPEWPESMKNALRKLWNMYEQRTIEVKSKDEVIDELVEEIKQIHENHQDYIKVTNSLFARFPNKVMKENYQRIMLVSELEKALVEAGEVKAKIERENMELKKEVELLKHIQAAQAQVFMSWKKDASEGKDVMKEEKKRLEYVIVDLLEDGEENKSKLEKIKAICDE